MVEGGREAIDRLTRQIGGGGGGAGKSSVEKSLEYVFYYMPSVNEQVRAWLVVLLHNIPSVVSTIIG